MRILHTSDLHIGKRLENRPRFSEQKEVLNSIVNIAKTKLVDLVLIAGDVYDTYTPPAEGEKLFYDFLADLTSAGISVLAVSGNHDDPQRLTAASSIVKEGGVFFADSENGALTSSNLPKLNFIEGGDDYFIFEKDGEKLCFAALPYPTELRMKEKINENESYEDKVKRYISEAFSKNQGLPTVLVGHIFMLGGEKIGSERDIDLGGARIISKSVIPNECIYTALGHLHKRQVVDKSRNIIYSGSTMQFSFDEAGYEKSVTVFDVICGKAENIQTVKIEGYKELYRVSANSLEEGEKLVLALDGYVELTLKLSEPLSSDSVKEFLSKYPFVILRMIFQGSEGYEREDRRLLSDEELFKAYCDYRFSSEPSGEILQLFLSIMNEVEVGDETEEA